MFSGWFVSSETLPDWEWSLDGEQLLLSSLSSDRGQNVGIWGIYAVGLDDDELWVVLSFLWPFGRGWLSLSSFSPSLPSFESFRLRVIFADHVAPIFFLFIARTLESFPFIFTTIISFHQEGTKQDREEREICPAVWRWSDPNGTEFRICIGRPIEGRHLSGEGAKVTG